MRRSQTSAEEKISNRSAVIRGFEAGIGIDTFLKGKSFFITGATGFLSKVLIEKILRTALDVDKIYVLIKAKNKEAAFDRLKNEIINIELFRSLQEIHRSEFQEFMFKKLIPVTGNMTKAKMGIDAAMAKEISQEVDIIVYSAANTTFDERFDNRNTQKLFDVMSEEERIEYCFDVGEVDWEEYILNIHIPGLRRHVMKGRGI